MNQKVLVTGATGYIAGWLIKYLLEEGHQVRATVRNLSNEEKIAHLISLDALYPGKLELFEADLLNKSDFDEPMKGCSIVFHMASPFTIGKVKDSLKDLVEPALKGTENVLNAVNRSESVTRVILTSSTAAIYGDSIEIKDAPGGKFDESVWNVTSSLDHQPYPYSKTLAERRAWEIYEGQKKWSMAVINPAFVFGPSLTKYSNSGSIEMMKQIGSGKAKAGLPLIYFGIVDVRDVARAHISAAFDNSVEGRHILSNEVLSLYDLADALRNSFSGLPLPGKPLPSFIAWLAGPLVGFSWGFLRRNLGIPIRMDNSKSIIKLGVKYRPVQDSLREHMQQMIDDGMVK